MTKKEVLKRVTRHGKRIKLSEFSWDCRTKTFSSELDFLMIDFGSIDCVTIISGHSSTQKAGDGSTQKAGDGSTQEAGHSSTQKAGHSSTQKAGDGSIQEAGHSSTQKAGHSSTWVIDGIRYTFPPLHLSGPMWDIHINRPGYLTIGRLNTLISEWDDRKGQLSIAEALSDDKKKEYDDLVRVAILWAETKNWLEPIK